MKIVAFVNLKIKIRKEDENKSIDEIKKSLYQYITEGKEGTKA